MVLQTNCKNDLARENSAIDCDLEWDSTLWDFATALNVPWTGDRLTLGGALP